MSRESIWKIRWLHRRLCTPSTRLNLCSLTSPSTDKAEAVVWERSSAFLPFSSSWEAAVLFCAYIINGRMTCSFWWCSRCRTWHHRKRYLLFTNWEKFSPSRTDLSPFLEAEKRLGRNIAATLSIGPTGKSIGPWWTIWECSPHVRGSRKFAMCTNIGPRQICALNHYIVLHSRIFKDIFCDCELMKCLTWSLSPRFWSINRKSFLVRHDSIW